MSLLVLEGGGHEQRQDLVEKGPGAEISGLVRDLPQRGLALRGGAVLDLQEHAEDLALLRLLGVQLLVVHLVHQFAEVLRGGGRGERVRCEGGVLR